MVFFDSEYLMYWIACAITMPVSWFVIKVIDNWTQS